MKRGANRGKKIPFLSLFSVVQQPNSALCRLIGVEGSIGRHLNNTQQKQETNSHAFSGIRTRYPSNRALCLRPHGHRDRV